MNLVAFVGLTDARSYVAAVRLERAAAVHTIITGEPVEIGYRAASPDDSTPPVDLVSAARISGIDLNIDEIVTADPTDAWRLLTWAIESGPGVQRDLLHQLWRAHFLEGADIADSFTLASRAALVGLELEQAEALLASEEYAYEVGRQLDMADELLSRDSDRQLPLVATTNGRTVSGLHSQDEYLQALSGLAKD